MIKSPRLKASVPLYKIRRPPAKTPPAPSNFKGVVFSPISGVKIKVKIISAAGALNNHSHSQKILRESSN